jgi:energy-converting hydrogenase Eha subunit H
LLFISEPADPRLQIDKTAGIISSVNKDFEDGMRNKKPVYVTIPKIVRKLYNIFILNADGVITTEDLFDYIKFILICIVDSRWFLSASSVRTFLKRSSTTLSIY